MTNKELINLLKELAELDITKGADIRAHPAKIAADELKALYKTIDWARDEFARIRDICLQPKPCYYEIGPEIATLCVNAKDNLNRMATDIVGSNKNVYRRITELRI